MTAEPQDEEEEFFVMRQRPHPVLNTAPPEHSECVNPTEEPEAREPPAPEIPIERPQECQRSMQNLRLLNLPFQHLH